MTLDRGDCEDLGELIESLEKDEKEAAKQALAVLLHPSATFNGVTMSRSVYDAEMSYVGAGIFQFMRDQSCWTEDEPWSIYEVVVSLGASGFRIRDPSAFKEWYDDIFSSRLSRLFG